MLIRHHINNLPQRNASSSYLRRRTRSTDSRRAARPPVVELILILLCRSNSGKQLVSFLPDTSVTIRPSVFRGPFREARQARFTGCRVLALSGTVWSGETFVPSFLLGDGGVNFTTSGMLQNRQSGVYLCVSLCGCCQRHRQSPAGSRMLAPNLAQHMVH